MMYKISIITAVFNGRDLLPSLIKSVKQQTYANKEFIIIDGGSTDGTVEIIKANEEIVSYWISETDGGIYDAWNKGIEKATGDWIMFLGCDDCLTPNSLNTYIKFIEQLDKPEELDIVHSKARTVKKGGETIRITGWKHQWPLFLKEMTIEHVGALHSRRLFNLYGTFNANYRIVGDYELLLRPGINLKTAFLNEVTVIVREGGVSESLKAIKEHYKAATTTGGYPIYKALINAGIVYTKFEFKRLFRKIGFNFYLRKAS